MEFDVEGHLAAVQRTVSFLERDGQPRERRHAVAEFRHHA